jgi:hypothetical protein
MQDMKVPVWTGSNGVATMAADGERRGELRDPGTALHSRADCRATLP